MSAQHRISAGVVMYGRPLEARQCLESLAAHSPQTQVFLVDNASPNGALEELRAQPLPGGTKLLQNAKNLGYGGGHNTVLPLLQSRYHAVINPDIVLQNDAPAQMADYMDAHPDVAITTPNLFFPDGRQQHIAKRRPALLPLLARQLGHGLWQKHEAHYLMLDEDLSRPTDVAFCSGSFFVIRTEVFKAIGGFDEKYFMYVEDADITQKALRCGRAVYLPDVRVTHQWHREAHGNLRKFCWQLKSMLRYFRKWGFRLK